MVEIRRLIGVDGESKLQYRFLLPQLMGNGSISVTEEWSEWKDVESIDQGLMKSIPIDKVITTEPDFWDRWDDR